MTIKQPDWEALNMPTGPGYEPDGLRDLVLLHVFDGCANQ